MEADAGLTESAQSSPVPAKRQGPTEAEVFAGVSKMKSASEHREAESRLQEATPPRVSESSEEVTASVLSRANVASVQQSEPESEEGEESEEEPEEQLEEEKETEAEGVPGSDRFSSQVTCAYPAFVPHPD